MNSNGRDVNKIYRVLYIAIMVIIVVTALVLILTAQPVEARPLKIGCIFSGRVDETGWNGSNYGGISSACEAAEIELCVRENIPEEEQACVEAVASLVGENCSVVFLTSYGYEQYADRLTGSYPGIKFCVTGSDTEDTAATYYLGRMYEGRYLAGIVAGLTTKTNVIGYVAAMPNNEVNRGINAFAIGVKRVAPDARVKVIFTGSWDDAEKEKAAARKLAEMSADVMTYHQNQESVPEVCDELGIDFIGYNRVGGEYSEHFLTSIECSWDKIYTSIIRDIQNGRNPGGMYWFGISDGAIRLTDYSENVSIRARYEVMFAINRINAGRNVFSGEIYDNSGVLRCAAGETLSDSSLIHSMDWFAEGVDIYEGE